MRLGDDNQSSTGALVVSVIRRVRFREDMPCRFGLMLLVLQGVGRPRDAGTLTLGQHRAREELPITLTLAPADWVVQAEFTTHPFTRGCQRRWQ